MTRPQVRMRLSQQRNWVRAPVPLFRCRPLTALGLVAACATPRAVSMSEEARLVVVGQGWARSSVNAVVFRRNSVITHEDTQYTAYYDAEGRVILATRVLGSSEWELHQTRYTGSASDAHNAICIAVDGQGILHMAWDHHGQPLRYARGVRPGSLELTDPQPMTGRMETAVTYPEFYRLPDGDLLFLYRDGSSGQGNVLLNRYDAVRGEWRVVQHPLIDGEGERNAYVNQLAVDNRGGWHISWTWRETPDVATNHDVLYAYSPDEGRSWQTSAGQPYSLPITARTAEIVRHVPEGSELINQTSMAVDERGRPLIATYWRPEGSEDPQFHLVWYDGQGWRTSQVGRRSQPFRLSGGGTKRIPISRPQVLAGGGDAVYVVFRDEERGGGISMATARDPDRVDWQIFELDAWPVGMWEPTYDPVLWNREHCLHLFHQRVGQGDAETLEELPAQLVSILEWHPDQRLETLSASSRCVTP